MFQHVGRTLRILARIICAVGILASIALAVLCWLKALSLAPADVSAAIENLDLSAFLLTGGKPILIGLGFFFLVFGILFSIFISALTYAFGQHVDDTHRLAWGRRRGNDDEAGG